MKHLSIAFAAGLALTALAQAAQAADMSNCELVLVKVIKAPDGSGEMHIQSFVDAKTFIASALDESSEHLTQIGGDKIKALLCTRNDVIPSESDYPILATGIPLSLSQKFDSFDTDSLTVKWVDGSFKFKYAGYPLSDEATATLRARLAKFSKLGLNSWAQDVAEAKDITTGDIEISGATPSNSQTEN